MFRMRIDVVVQNHRSIPVHDRAIRDLGPRTTAALDRVTDLLRRLYSCPDCQRLIFLISVRIDVEVDGRAGPLGCGFGLRRCRK